LKIEKGLEQTSRILQKTYGLEASPVKFSYVSATTDEAATVSVEIDPSSERPFYSDEFLNIWQEQVGDIPGARQLSFYVDYELSEDLRIELSALDNASLKKAMGVLKEKVRRFKGVYDIRTNLDNRVSELSVRLKPQAAFLGLTHGDVVGQLRNAIFGFEAQRIQHEGEEVRVKVRYPKSERNDVGDLEKIRIRTPDGGRVPLFEIAEILPGTIQSEILRIDGDRVFVLTAQIDTDTVSPTELISVLEGKVFPEVSGAFPGIAIALGGESEAEGEATLALESGFMIGLILIYALLAIPLKSYTEPLLIMVTIPFGIIGAIGGHMIMGLPFSFLSFFGLLALSGVVVNDALVFISHYKTIRTSDPGYETAVVQAGRDRFRAVFLTSVTTFVGLAPLVLEKSQQAQELIPMAVSLSFGILFATIITLFMIPVLLGIHLDIKQRFTFGKNPSDPEPGGEIGIS
ncbi:MAG: efflux RND transporter permease subunit, partial [Desulfobacterales bacterium]|nr:efflux RND transporter permease subunit [Desulfobacterales bacterium]